MRGAARSAHRPVHVVRRAHPARVLPNGAGLANPHAPIHRALRLISQIGGALMLRPTRRTQMIHLAYRAIPALNQRLRLPVSSAYDALARAALSPV